MVYARSCREKFEFYDRSNDENLSDLQTFWSQESIDLISYYYVAMYGTYLVIIIMQIRCKKVYILNKGAIINYINKIRDHSNIT